MCEYEGRLGRYHVKDLMSAGRIPKDLRAFSGSVEELEARAFVKCFWFKMRKAQV